MNALWSVPSILLICVALAIPVEAGAAENLNCNSPSNVSRLWIPAKEQLQELEDRFAKVGYRFIASHTGKANVQYDLRYCGIHEGETLIILLNGFNKIHGKDICDDPLNFAAAYFPTTQTFGTFHFAPDLCPPDTKSAPAAR